MKKILLLLPALLSFLFNGCTIADVALLSAKKKVKDNYASCILLKDGKIKATETGRGIAPLLKIHDNCSAGMSGGILVDKVIGKAAAMIAIHGKVAAIHTELISEPALEILQKHGISVTYEKCVPQILNRTRDDLCPMEKRVAQVNDPDEALKLLRK